MGYYEDLPPCKSVLEIGSLGGGTLKRFIENAAPNSHVVSIDMLDPGIYEDQDRIDQKLGHEGLWAKWAQKAGVNFRLINRSSHDPDTKSEVYKMFPGGLDFIFIDGGHSYNDVEQDFNDYYPLLKKGGFVALHDVIGIPDIRNFFNSIRETYPLVKMIYKGANEQGVPCGIGLFTK